MRPLRQISTFRNFQDGLPWRNNPGGFEFASQRGAFQPAMIIKMIPVRDMSRPQQSNYNSFDAYIDDVTHHIKKGMHVRAIKVNGQTDTREEDVVSGIIEDVVVEHEHKRIRVYIRDEQSNQRIEVYVQTVYAESPSVYESQKYVKNFNEFVAAK